MKLKTTFLALATTVGLFNIAASAKDFPSGSPDFKHSYAEAEKEAKASGKPMLLVFSASWCPPCQTNKRNVYPSDAVKPYHDKFVWAYIDTDKKSNASISRKFGVRGIPHVQFATSGGKAIDKAVGGTSPARFAATLQGVLKKAG